MRKFLSCSALVLVFMALAGGLGAQTATIKVGGIFDLSGPTGDVGQPYALGVRDYIDFLNSKGGINGARIDFEFSDCKYDTNAAVAYYEKLLADKVVAIIGWGTGETLALAPKVAQSKIPFVSGSYDELLAAPDKNPYNFVIGATYSDQVRVVLSYISTNMGKGTKVAFFHSASAFGESPLAAAEQAAGKYGLVIVDKVPMAKDLDIAAKVRELAGKGVKAVIIQNTAVPAYNVIKAVGDSGSPIRIFGLNWAFNESIIKLAGRALDGFVYPGLTKFSYEDAPGLVEIAGIKKSEISKTAKYIQGWVTAKVVFEGVKAVKGEITGEKIKAALESITIPLGGISEPIAFSAKSHKGTTRVKLYQFNFDQGKFLPITDYIDAQK